MDKNLNNPKVSVLMPAYNATAYVRQAIESVLSQTFGNFELIIVNDGSTDNTESMVKNFRDPRIRYIKNENNSGIGAVRNQLFSLARGEYIALLDADDIALPERLGIQVRFLDSNPDFALVGTWVALIDEKGKETGIKWKNRAKPEDMRAALYFGNQFTQSSVMLRKKDLPTPVYKTEYAPAEDHDLWMRLAETKKLSTVRRVLTHYRVLSQSAVHGNNAQKIAREKILTDNLARLGIIASDEERILHQNNFVYTGKDKMEFLKKREAWLLKLVHTNSEKKIFDGHSFEKIAGERWLASCRANSEGIRTWKLCWRSPLASYIFWSESWRDIVKFALRHVIL